MRDAVDAAPQPIYGLPPDQRAIESLHALAPRIDDAGQHAPVSHRGEWFAQEGRVIGFEGGQHVTDLGDRRLGAPVSVIRETYSAIKTKPTSFCKFGSSYSLCWLFNFEHSFLVGDIAPIRRPSSRVSNLADERDAENGCIAFDADQSTVYSKVHS